MITSDVFTVDVDTSLHKKTKRTEILIFLLCHGLLALNLGSIYLQKGRDQGMEDGFLQCAVTIPILRGKREMDPKRRI